LQVQRRSTLVTGRVGRVDSDQLLQELNCFRADFGPIDISGWTGRDEKQESN
jgi:hypothetical protein